MIEVARLKDLNAAKLFLGFRIRAISRRDFAIFPVPGQRGLRRLKRYFGDKMSVGAQMVVVLNGFESGRRNQPWSRVAGDSTPRPQTQRSRKGFVHRLLGKIKITVSGSELPGFVPNPRD